MSKKIILIIVFMLIGAALLAGLYFWNQVSLPAGSSDETVLYQITSGQGVKEIADNLEKQGLIRSAYWFEWYVYLEGSESDFIAGTYSLRPDMNMREVVSALKSGNTAAERSITILEGWTTEEIGEYLEQEGVVSKDSFVEGASLNDSRDIIPGKTYDFLADKPDGQGLEGYLFPDTYRIFETAETADIIERMLNNFGNKFTEQMALDAAASNMDIHQIVTLASIIENEVNIERKDGEPINNDHYIVAGIFYNRLNNGIALESDATVNYVTKGDRPQPTAADLAAESPYNTYRNRGLPPGPIGNPSLEAIKAAVYPADTDYMYFLHRINDDGSIVFSRTFQEHVANKQKYLQ